MSTPSPTPSPRDPQVTIDAHAAQGYPQLKALLAERVAAAVGPLFTTDAAELFEAFLAGLPEAERQGYRCGACRGFVESCGGLVSIDEKGRAEPLLWAPGVPDFFAASVEGLRQRVRAAEVTGVFLSSAEVWGRPVTGPWTHLHGRPAAALRFRQSPVQTAGQRMAALKQDHQTLTRGLSLYPTALVRRASALLTNGQLERSEKAEGVARWLLELRERLDRSRGREAEQLVWRAVATAPPGFAHVQSTVIGTLLDDLAEERALDEIKARWAAKLHPLQYQRPQAGPTAGQLAEAERLVEKLGLAPALPRRFARRADLSLTWEAPAPKHAAKGGVFAHLRPRAEPASADGGELVMTWDKFARTVLPRAEEILLRVPTGPSSFGALVTAEDPDAPPILQWDRPGARNPVSFYVYVGGSPAASWGLKADDWHPVTGVTLLPHLWSGDRAHAHHGKGLVLLLDGARDLKHTASGGFFPEFLRAELHPVRAALEAYAKAAKISGRDEGDGCGLMLWEKKTGERWGVRLQVLSRGVRTVYELDRWD